MKDFQVKKHGRKREEWYFSRWMVFILVLVVASLIRGVYDNYEKNQLTDRDLKSVQAEVANLQEQKAFLDAKLSRLRTSAGLDEEIRKNFPVAKPGERVIMIVDDQAEVTTSLPTSSARGFSVKKMLGF